MGSQEWLEFGRSWPPSPARSRELGTRAADGYNVVTVTLPGKREVACPVTKSAQGRMHDGR